MTAYLEPIFYAILIFPIIAIVFTIPYIVFEYRKYGSILVMRTAIVYSLILYLITIYFLVILPLPSIQEVENLTGLTMQLTPFTFLQEITEKTNFSIANPSTYLPSLLAPGIMHIVLNVAMFIPLGVYLRYYFKCRMFKTICISLLLSLFFECTQLSGLYGIYPRAYRLFDVDDLIVNTIGGLLGYIITPLICFFLPSKEKLDEKAYEKGESVSLFRRLVAVTIDFILIIPMMYIVKKLLNIEYIYLCIPACYFIISCINMKGQTIGKKAVKIALKNQEQETPKIIYYILRYGILYLIILPTPIIILYLLKNISNTFIMWFISCIGICWLLYNYLRFIYQFFMTLLTKENHFSYEKWSKIKNISTIKKEQNEKE